MVAIPRAVSGGLQFLFIYRGRIVALIVAIPRAVSGGLQCEEATLPQCHVVELQYRERYQEGYNDNLNIWMEK